MITIGLKSLADARRRPVEVLGGTFHKSEWMDSGEDTAVLSPTVFLAEQPPDYVLPTHFHKQNQFQLFVEGAGSLGPDAVGPVTIHYAGAYTRYGPLVSGSGGLKYFTIRAIFDTGRTFSSEGRSQMVRGPKRHSAAAVGAPWDTARLAALEHVESTFPMPPARGLAARHARLPPTASIPIEPIAESDGQFIFILSGSARLGDAGLARWESAFVSANESGVNLIAGEQGAEVVCLHVPVTAPEYAFKPESAMPS